jgi:DNA gyrase subunit A
MYIPPFTVSAEAINLIAEISGQIERYAIRLEQEDGLRLRKVNRIKTIHSSLAIEGNTLSEDQVRDMGRIATGVIGMRPDEGGDDEVVGMVCVNDPQTETIMVVSENGYGKRSEVEDYCKTARGAKGVKTLAITEKTGRLVAIKVVTDENDLMIINKSGILIRLKVADVRVMGRNTQGVRLINLAKKNDVIASVCKVMHSQAEEEDIEEAEIIDEEPSEAIDTPLIETPDEN